MGAVVGWLAAWVLAAIIRYRRWVCGRLTPHLAHGIYDATFERWNNFRNVLGLILVVLAHARWRWPEGDYTMAIEASWESMLRSLLGGSVLVILASIAMPLFARSGHRVAMLRNMCAPLCTLLGCAAFVATLPASANLLADSGTAAPSTAWLVLAVILTLAVPFYLFGVWFGVPVVVRHFFRARDGHPALRAIIMIALSGWTLAVGVSGTIGGTVDARFPAIVSIVLLVVGPLANIVLSWWEIHRLRTHWGVRLRQAG